MNKMEKLLNELIKKGWKPFGIKSDNIWLYCLSDNKIVISYYDFDTEWECNHEDKWCDLRQLTSKESWLWKFVCENGMVNNVWNFVYRRLRNGKKFWFDKPITHFTFRLIEASLKDESELEDFLLQNIKVWNED